MNSSSFSAASLGAPSINEATSTDRPLFGPRPNEQERVEFTTMPSIQDRGATGGFYSSQFAQNIGKHDKNLIRERTEQLGSCVNLLACLQSRHEHAYEELVRKFGGRLLAVARRYLRSEEDASDAVQNAFLCIQIDR